MISLVLAVLAQATQPASRPSAIRVGDTLDVSLEHLPPEGLALELATAEPLTLLAESYDADVALAVESGRQSLAQDDDSGIETNARPAWTPTTTGAFSVRLTAKPPARGTAIVMILRGATARQPADPKQAAIAYWDLAQERARGHGDEARAALALGKLAALEGRADGGAALAARAERDAAKEAALALLSDAQALEEHREIAAARAKVREAIERIAAKPADERDAVLAALARDAWKRANAERERVLPADHLDLQRARANLASTMDTLGDFRGARALEEKALAVLERTLPPDALEHAAREPGSVTDVPGEICHPCAGLLNE